MRAAGIATNTIHKRGLKGKHITIAATSVNLLVLKEAIIVAYVNAREA